MLSPRPSPKRRGRDVLGLGLLGVVTLVALLLRLHDLGGRSLWVDEAMSVVLAARPLPELFGKLVTEDIHPPLYPLLLHYWMALFGSGEASVRFPSLLFGVALVPLIYVAGRRLESMANPGGRQLLSLVGLVAATIAATSTFYVAYSQAARNYMAATFMGLLSSYLLLRALEDGVRGAQCEVRSADRTAERGPQTETPEPRTTHFALRTSHFALSTQHSALSPRWVAYAAATAAALYTHYTAFLLLAFHLLFVALAAGFNGRVWRGWLLSLGGVALVYLPWLGYSVGQLLRISDYWPGSLQLDAALQTSLLLLVAGGGMGSGTTALPVLLGLALLVLGLLALALGGFRRKSARPILFLLLYLLVPSALLFAVVYYRPKFDPRYLLVATPAFYLILAWGIASLLRAALSHGTPLLLRVVLPCVVVAALAGTVAVSAVYGEPAKLTHVGDGRTGVQQYGDYRSLVAYLESRSQTGDSVVMMMNTYHPYLYYSKLGIPWYEMEPFDDFDGAIIRLNRMVEAGHSRLWFILWQKEWADPADYVMHTMETQAKEVPLDASFGGIGLRLFELMPGERFSYFPKVEHRMEALFGGRALEFWGWNVSAGEVVAGGSVKFDLHWRPLKRTDARLKSKVMLMDGDLLQWGNVDEVMVSPFYPSPRWKEQEILHDRHTLTVPAGTPPGSYRLMLLVYDENSMKDLSIERWSGESLGTLLPLGALAVTPTPEDAFPPASRQPVATWELEGGSVELLSARAAQAWARPGEPADVELLWRVPRPPKGDYALHVALLDVKAEVVSRLSVPLVRDYPAARWRQGEPVLSRHRLPVPAQLPLGEYALAVAVTASQERDVPADRYARVSRLEVQNPGAKP